ncbi:hypothetical protein A9264_08895 [Vibrio sp. UCD-FRSSP16_10]|nr:hypothetical protein A9260_05995 [Vibrio sp. UCD-FRSSP16_30]OBT22143.1 hypothetical protein A9264_08895 [Vibrio sp. UCD-FRSSP16_10]
MDINQIATFLGWCTTINIGMLIFATTFLFLFKDFTMSVHSKITGVRRSHLPTLYFSYLANYKVGILLLNLTPYIVLKLMF